MNRHLAGTLCLLLAILPAPTRAEPLLAARTLRANTVIDSADLALPEGESPAALSNIEWKRALRSTRADRSSFRT